MKQELFKTFGEVSEFARQRSRQSGVSVGIKNDGDEWVAEYPEPTRESAIRVAKHPKPRMDRRPHWANDRIRDLLTDCIGQIEPRNSVYMIGDGGESWLNQVGHEFDRSKIRSAKVELRKEVEREISRIRDAAETESGISILNELDIAIHKSDMALFGAARALFRRPTTGLFNTIKKIVENARKSG